MEAFRFLGSACLALRVPQDQYRPIRSSSNNEQAHCLRPSIGIHPAAQLLVLRVLPVRDRRMQYALSRTCTKKGCRGQRPWTPCAVHHVHSWDLGSDRVWGGLRPPILLQQLVTGGVCSQQTRRPVQELCVTRMLTIEMTQPHRALHPHRCITAGDSQVRAYT
ncbi:hypothetical protein BD413DRAFT_55563 [Trametes elegans]|nr:hypothetical protein BD413DRAFT_55563 [Trametes elegans]